MEVVAQVTSVAAYQVALQLKEIAAPQAPLPFREDLRILTMSSGAVSVWAALVAPAPQSCLVLVAMVVY